MAKPIQLYSLATPNGQKVSVALEELGLPYETHVINIMKGDQFTDEFKKVNPNSKIPAIVDPDGPGGKELALFESGAILLYLAEKTGKLLPADPAAKWETVSWLMFQMGGVGPMFGQFGHFSKYAPEKVPYAIERYTKEVKRLLSVLETRLTGKQFIMGDDYTIADIAIFPWVNGLSAFYKGDEALGLADFKNVNDWLTRCMDRPASKTGMKVAPFPSS
jgi:GST-like protein